MPLTVTISGCEDSCGNNLSNLNVDLTLSDSESVATQLILTTGLPPEPINLTSYDVKMQINFPTPLLLDIENEGITLPDADAGTLQINMSYETTSAFPVGSFPYDLWTISPANETIRVIGGVFNVLQSVTPIP